MKYKPLAFQGSLLPGEQGRIWQIPLFNTFIDPIALVFVKFSNNARMTSKWREENSREKPSLENLKEQCEKWYMG